MITWWPERKPETIEQKKERWAKARANPPKTKLCPECGHMMHPWFDGGANHIGYKCQPCGFNGVGRPYGVDGVTPALGGLNPCGIIDETWEYQIEQRKRAQEKSVK